MACHLLSCCFFFLSSLPVILCDAPKSSCMYIHTAKTQKFRDNILTKAIWKNNLGKSTYRTSFSALQQSICNIFDCLVVCFFYVGVYMVTNQRLFGSWTLKCNQKYHKLYRKWRRRQRGRTTTEKQQQPKNTQKM